MKMKYLIIFLFFVNLGWFNQVSAICENPDDDTVISITFSKEKEFLFLDIRAQAVNPIFSCEFSLKYDSDVLQFVEYQIEENWLTHVAIEKNELKILQSRFHNYTYWITDERISLGALKFKIRKKTATEFVFKKLIVIELEQFINPKINDQPCWPKKIRAVF